MKYEYYLQDMQEIIAELVRFQDYVAKVFQMVADLNATLPPCNDSNNPEDYILVKKSIAFSDELLETVKKQAQDIFG